MVVILLTGGGKSMHAIIPSLFEETAATVLILPLNSLIMDYQRRLTNMKIPFQVYNTNNSNGVLNTRDRLIIVSADKAQTSKWQEALVILSQQKPIM